MIVWLPRSRLDVENEAWPPASSETGPPSGVAASRKTTLPWVTAALSDVTVAVNVTGWPTPEGLADEASTVWLGAAPTFWVTDALLAPKPGAPEYAAVIVCGPGPRAEVVNAACPLAFKAVGPARTVAPSEKVTAPSVTGAPETVTVAVNVTGSPKADGFGEASSMMAAGRLNVATTGSWSEMRSGRVGSLRRASGKSASARAN